MFYRYFGCLLKRRFVCSKSRLKYVILFAVLLLFIGLLSDIHHIPGFPLWRKKVTNEKLPQYIYEPNLPLEMGNIKRPRDNSDSAVVIKKPTLQTFSSVVNSPPPMEVTPSVLIFADSEKIIRKSKLKDILKSLRVNYDFVAWNRIDDYSLSMPRLQDKYGYTRYHTIIFTSHYIYDEIDSYDKNLLLKHCLHFKIGIIIFADIMHVNMQTKFHSLRSLPVSIQSGIMSLRDLHIEKSSMLHITKAGSTLKGPIPGKRHAIFHSDHKSFEPVAVVWKDNDTRNMWSVNSPLIKSEAEINRIGQKDHKAAFIMFDKGKYDGIQRVLFGTSPSNSWLTQLLFIDALSVLSNKVFGFNLDRLIQIDIDDIFVGQKLIKEDVLEIIKAQEYLATQIPGFMYNLGFSFKHYKNSNNSLEREGDEEFIKNAHKFRWFCHTYGHIKPHQYTKEEIIDDLKMNKAIAQIHRIPVDTTYSVSPHHSGVYPTHEALYEAWKEVWGIKVTSTEQYPNIYPAYGRKGFIYQDIMVLPRQTCGIFTGTLHLATHPHGPDYLYKITHGGDLFWSIINNPVIVFMTHMGNYGFQDRLGIHLFKNVTRFVKKWTNINLRSEKPIELAKKYFEMFPRNAEPQWSDPCTNTRHQQIWNETTRYCKPNEVSRISRLPDVLIVGPQKTGTTALYTFLSMHPELEKSRRSNSSFEEIQFFNRNHYKRGLRWYLDFFPDGKKKENHLYVEKSANYFDSLKTPLRAYSVIPNAKLVMIFTDPKHRAYSWYQHVRSKRESVALNHTFFDVISGRNKTDDPKFAVLTQRCLLPGRYAEALDRWLHYYDKSQIYVMDGYELRYKPHVAMRRLQEFLKISHFPFHRRIKYNQGKGFYCAVSAAGSFQCLGKSKGRQYNSMSDEAYQFLTDYYRVPNLRLADQLTSLRMSLPRWLLKEIKDRNTS